MVPITTFAITYARSCEQGRLSGSKGSGKCLSQVFPCGGRPVTFDRRLAQHEKGRSFAEEIHRRFDHHRSELRRRNTCRGGKYGSPMLFDFLAVPKHRALPQSCLIREPSIERTDRCISSFGNRGHRRGVVADLNEELFSRVQKERASPGSPFLLWDRACRV